MRGFQALSIRTLCAIAGLTRQRVFQEIAAGHLRACKVGSRTVIGAEDLLAWIESNPACIKQALSSDPKDAHEAPTWANLLKVQSSQSNFRLAYSIPEFASLTSLSPGLVRKEIKVGRLAGVKVSGDRIIISASAAEAWFRNLETRKAG